MLQREPATTRAHLAQGEAMPRNLAAAFEVPVFPRNGKSLTGASLEALMQYCQRLDATYGWAAEEWVAIVNLSDGSLPYHADKRKDSLDQALQVAMAGVQTLMGGALVPTLLLRLQGPMQSWGTASRFDYRDTDQEPSKSGVLGLFCAALGRDRNQPIADLADLRMGVRVDREGVRRYDCQTAMGVLRAEGSLERDARKSTVQS